MVEPRSLSGFLVWLGGPVHWSSKRQTITARSSVKAEIYATDECVKFLQYISFLLDGMHLKNEFMPEPNNIYNDNSASIHWAHNMTTIKVCDIYKSEKMPSEKTFKMVLSILST